MFIFQGHPGIQGEACRTSAAGGFTSQTTVLMQKQRQLEHLERLLDDKRREFVKRMRKADKLERLQVRFLPHVAQG